MRLFERALLLSKQADSGLRFALGQHLAGQHINDGESHSKQMTREIIRYMWLPEHIIPGLELMRTLLEPRSFESLNTAVLPKDVTVQVWTNELYDLFAEHISMIIRTCTVSDR